ncbi:hypothetical protein BB561_002981 [Smittium simulii]|uniref:BHLH domain-containing protein n=1 Tax=Smittium simulii TaxID=133385 RepID=A0A2T9YNL4_9FUNG|nr:hypothetical protein BB561_002981 [Smittium simulii]
MVSSEPIKSHYNKIHSLLNEEPPNSYTFQQHEAEYISSHNPRVEPNLQSNSNRPSQLLYSTESQAYNHPCSINQNLLSEEDQPLSIAHSLPLSQNQTDSFSKNASQYPVGSYEWESIRKENHKRVERRRREHINAGVSLLASLVPGCGKNKGKVLHQAAQYITQLTSNYNDTVSRYTNDASKNQKLISSLAAQLELLEEENKRLKRKIEDLSTNPSL